MASRSVQCRNILARGRGFHSLRGRVPFSFARRCASAMAGFPTIEEFTNDLKPSEQLLRGGYLKEPHLFTNLEMIQNRPYIKVCSGNLTLRMFLIGQVASRSLLQRRLACRLTQLRNSEQDSFFAEGPKENQDDASLEALGVEVTRDSTPRAPDNKPLSPERKNALRKQYPVITVEFPFGNESVTMRVKTVWTKQEQPTIEASVSNFRALFCWCRIEAISCEGAPPPSIPAALSQPRGEPGDREYFRKDRMCYYTMRSGANRKKYGQRTEVVERRTMGRPGKRAREASVPQPASRSGESNSALEISANSESQDSLGAEF